MLLFNADDFGKTGIVAVGQAPGARPELTSSLPDSLAGAYAWATVRRTGRNVGGYQ
jgi:hypothetical protein